MFPLWGTTPVLKTPDIVVVEGVRPTAGSRLGTTLTDTRRRKATVHILEVAYAGDTEWARKQEDKLTKYTDLRRALDDAGWKVEFRTFVVGATGVVYEHNDDVLRWMGVDTDKARRDALKDIAEHSKTEAAALLTTYDNLEREVTSAPGGGGGRWCGAGAGCRGGRV